MQNRLKQYKSKTFSEWKDIAKDTGLNDKQLIRISKMDINQVLKLTLNTYLVLKVTIGVDLLEIKYDKRTN